MITELTAAQFTDAIKAARLTNPQIGEISHIINRGDSIAVYRYTGEGNMNGRYQFLSFGGRWAKIKKPTPPHRMPSNLGILGWKQYELVGCYPRVFVH